MTDRDWQGTGVFAVLKRYAKRFEQAATDSPGLTVFQRPDGIRELYPSQAHAVWAMMSWATSAVEAEVIAREFLG